MRVRRLAVVAAIILSAILVAACGGASSAKKAYNSEASKQAASSYNLDTNQPAPVFNHSQIRQELIDIERATADGVQSTSFFENYGVNYGASGVQPPQSCPSIGAPVPVTDQLTNPQQIIKDNTVLNNGGGNEVIGQEDPNGVYTGEGSGTYVMCVDSSGQTYAAYWEGPVYVVFGPATWSAGASGPHLVGQPSSYFSDVKSTPKP